jgi:hypothetical protein
VAMTPTQTLHIQLERLRSLYTLLSTGHVRRRQAELDDLLERTRVASAAVRKTRRLLSAASDARDDVRDLMVG